MKILWVGNAHWACSGYGEQANLFVPRLGEQGHDVAVLANYGLNGRAMSVEGIQYYGGSGDWENQSMPVLARKHEADLVIVLHDAWVMHPRTWPEDVPPVAIWAPVDHFPLPPLVHEVLSQPSVRPIAMSRFGEQMMRQAGLDPAYVPHGVDTQVFRPQPELRDTVRDSLGIPRDAFVVGMVAANKDNPEVDRKSFAESISAFAQFARQYDDAYMYVHSQAKPTGGRGCALELVATYYGVPSGRIIFPSDDLWYLGAPRELVATLYQAFDVLLNASKGEGFGIPILEAQACGVPVIVSNHSAMTELCHAGWLVEGQGKWDELQKAEFFQPFTRSIVERLETAYAEARDPKLKASAVEFAAQYDADLVADEFWKPALEKATAAKSRVVIPSRAERRRLERAAKHPAAGHAAQNQKGVPV